MNKTIRNTVILVLWACICGVLVYKYFGTGRPGQEQAVTSQPARQPDKAPRATASESKPAGVTPGRDRPTQDLPAADDPSKDNPGQDPNRYEQGWPVLIEAAYRGDRRRVKSLLAQGADVNMQGPNKWTALMQAAGHGHAEIVRLLIEAGALINVENSARKNAYDLALERGYQDVADALYAQGAADDELRRFLVYTISGNEKNVHDMILAGFDPNRTDYRGRSALFYALTKDRDARYSDRSFTLREYMVKRLLENGADPNLQDHSGRTPFSAFVLEYGSLTTQIIDLLAKHGARFDVVDKAGMSLLCHRCGPAFAERLVKEGVDINRPDHAGMTPLHWQAKYRNALTVGVLLKHGADPSSVDKQGNTPIDALGPRPEGKDAEAWEQIHGLLSPSGNE